MNRRDFSEVKFVWVCDRVCGVGSVSLCVELHSESQRLLRGEVCVGLCHSVWSCTVNVVEVRSVWVCVSGNMYV